MKELNFEKNNNINCKIIDVFCAEIQQLSEKNQRTDEDLQSTVIHQHLNATFNIILQTHKSELVFTFIGKVNP